MGYKVTAVDDEESGNLQLNMKFQIEPPLPAEYVEKIEMLLSRKHLRNDLAAAIQSALDHTNQ